VIVGIEGDQEGAHEWPVSEIEGLADVVQQRRRHLPLAGVQRGGRQIQRRQAHASRIENVLRWDAIVHGKHRSQRLVARHDVVEALLERARIQ
jgi:hypothetical protein